MPTPLDHSRNATSVAQFLEQAAERYAGHNAFSCGPMHLEYSR